jgi:hypothetical protein
MHGLGVEGLDPVLGDLLDVRAPVVVLRGEPVDPHPGRLDEVIVDRDHLDVIGQWHEVLLAKHGPAQHGPLDDLHLVVSAGRGLEAVVATASC